MPEIPFQTTYRPGDYNVVDDLHGFKYKRSECRMRWDGVLVHRSDWEPRHPMDHLRVQKDRIKVAEARPDVDRFEQTPVTADDL